MVLIHAIIISILCAVYYLNWHFPFNFEKMGRMACIFFLIFDLIYGAFSKDFVYCIFFTTILFPWFFYLFFNFKKTILLTLCSLLIFPLNNIANKFFPGQIVDVDYKNMVISCISIFNVGLLFLLLYFYTEICACKRIMFYVENNIKNIEETPAKKITEIVLNTSNESIFEKIDQYMTLKQPWRNADYNLEQMAKDLNLNIFQISTAINHCTKDNFKTYLNDCRLNAFTEEIKSHANKDVYLKEIYLDLGFNSRVTFNRNFKNKFGETPQDYIVSNKI
ncbi:helix-turn-helix domain-containing protein [Flavobacterium sp. 2]|uniref:helix-turn-helix domain-containing protein n=1 Tax=Flavobacterium sp. 2 TaxID=308053 RepID=UPI003CF85B5E